MEISIFKKEHGQGILKRILPVGCRPIVVTDAGFRNTWFSHIAQLDWDFIGRVRHQTLIKLSDSNWTDVRRLHILATTTPKYLGKATVARTNPMNLLLPHVASGVTNAIQSTIFFIYRNGFCYKAIKAWNKKEIRQAIKY